METALEALKVTYLGGCDMPGKELALVVELVSVLKKFHLSHFAFDLMDVLTLISLQLPYFLDSGVASHSHRFV